MSERDGESESSSFTNGGSELRERERKRMEKGEKGRT